MDNKKNYNLEDEITKVTKLLDSSELKDLMDSDDFKDSVGDNPKTLDQMDSTPGSLSFRMDAMKMNYYMELKAPFLSDQTITLEDIKIELEKHGPYLESVVNWDIIKEAYDDIMIEGQIIPEVKIAIGRPVEFRVAEHIILKESLTTDCKPTSIDGGRVNYHCIKSFIIVQQNEFLGDIIPEDPGKSGLNLGNIEIPSPKKTVNTFKPGANTYVVKNKLYSSINGTYKLLNGSLITIDPLLLIETDVDYHTGDIMYKGDIRITKTIREGFSIESEGDIIVNESIEATNIKCGNNLTIVEGIIGSTKHKIECKGKLTTTHIEHAIIKCAGSITVLKGVLSSKLYTLDKLYLEKNSSIVGGEVYCQDGMVAGNIGNESGIETKIVLGIDFQVKDKFEQLQQASKEINLEINKIQNMLKKEQSSEDRYKIKYAFLSLKNKLNSLQNFSRNLLSRLDKNDNSSLIVHGTIYPGTTIEICHISQRIVTKLTHVKFSLDKECGNIKNTML